MRRLKYPRRGRDLRKAEKVEEDQKTKRADLEGPGHGGFSREKSANELRVSLSLPISTCYFQQMIKQCNHFVYKEVAAKPPPKKGHRYACLKQTLDTVTWGPKKWAVTVFSDEKIFNLDGPDEFKHDCNDLRGEKQTCRLHQQGGGSFMVWTAFGKDCKCLLVLLKEQQKAVRYMATVKSHLLP